MNNQQEADDDQEPNDQEPNDQETDNQQTDDQQMDDAMPSLLAYSADDPIQTFMLNRPNLHTDLMRLRSASAPPAYPFKRPDMLSDSSSQEGSDWADSGDGFEPSAAAQAA